LSQDIKVTCFLNQPTLVGVLTNVIPKNREISGITVLEDELFIIRSNQERINVYSNSTFLPTRQLTIPGSKNLVAIVANEQNKSLYLSDQVLKSVYRFNPRQGKVIQKWPVGEECAGLSLTKSNNLLVTLLNTKKIRKYSPDGKFIIAINLDKSIEYPHHCIQLSNDHFVVCHEGDKQNRVCIVDTSGCIVKSYGGFHGTNVGQLNGPCHMAVDKYGNIMVTDCTNNRVEVLSPTLVHLGYVQISGHELKKPWTLHLDRLSNRLYIGEAEVGHLYVLRD